MVSLKKKREGGRCLFLAWPIFTKNVKSNLAQKISHFLHTCAWSQDFTFLCCDKKDVEMNGDNESVIKCVFFSYFTRETVALCAHRVLRRRRYARYCQSTPRTPPPSPWASGTSWPAARRLVLSVSSCSLLPAPFFQQRVLYSTYVRVKGERET